VVGQRGARPLGGHSEGGSSGPSAGVAPRGGGRESKLARAARASPHLFSLLGGVVRPDRPLAGPRLPGGSRTAGPAALNSGARLGAARRMAGGPGSRAYPAFGARASRKSAAGPASSNEAEIINPPLDLNEDEMPKIPPCPVSENGVHDWRKLKATGVVYCYLCSMTHPNWVDKAK
jgi:hypothetical protein